MFEITYNDSDTLQNFIDADKAYHGAVYDFTFEGRFIVYHFFVKDTARYVALDSMTGYGSEMTHRRKSNLFDHRSYHSMTPMVLASIKYTGDKRYLNVMVSNPLEAIESIFRTILPEYGFTVREAQIKLSQDMYLGLAGKQVAICEAEVGAGKTLAYLIASFVAKNRYAAEHGFSLPVTISTSSIELQKMIVEKEVPQLSRMLQDYGLIKHPLCAVVRKGKEHYFCKARYYDYLNKIMTHKEKYQNLLDYFTANNIAVRAFDLDLWDMPAAIKGKVCVKGGCSRCEYRDDCCYSCYVKAANDTGAVDFQVTNHNMFLTSIKASDSEATSRIIQKSPYVVIDEAHKLLEAAQTTFGEQFSEGIIQKYINSVRYLKSDRVKDNVYYLLDKARKANQQLFAMLRRIIPDGEFNDERTFGITIPDAGVSLILRLAETIATIEARRKPHRGAYEMDGKRIIKMLDQFVRQNNSNVWFELMDGSSLYLCCCPRNLADVMEKNVWNRSVSYVLTSGTMSDGRDFSFFKKENGIARLPKYLVSECTTVSPFDYQNHTRLYIPEDMPLPDNKSEGYINAITERILRLIDATNGHTAILFTSYKVLHSVYERAIHRLGKYEVFCMTRNSRKVISDFRKSRNGVLFASGSMWEGVDCIGDGLSSVIIVRLPFPLRSATMEQKKEAVGDVAKFVHEYAVPEMLIKLRQGVGRLIRCETDTGVISILDSRAANGSYVPRVKMALLKYPTVDSVEEVKAFMETVKGEDQLSVSGGGVDGLFLKINADAQLLQFPHRFQKGHGVSGKAGNGLGNDVINLSGTAVGKHPLEIFPTVLGAGLGFVCINAHILPAWVVTDVGAVMIHLGCQRVMHGILAIGNSGIRRHPKGYRHLGSKLDLFYGSRHGLLLCIKYRQLHILLVSEDIASPYRDEFRGKYCPVSGRFSWRERRLHVHGFVRPVLPSGRGDPTLRRGSDTE